MSKLKIAKFLNFHYNYTVFIKFLIKIMKQASRNVYNIVICMVKYAFFIETMDRITESSNREIERRLFFMPRHRKIGRKKEIY